MFVLFTLGAMQGVFLSNDLYTTFIFFEIMSFASYPMVIHNETDEAIDGSNSYLGFAVLGSLVSLMGLFMLQSILGTLQIDQLVEAASRYVSAAYVAAAGALSCSCACQCHVIRCNYKSGHLWYHCGKL